MHNRKLFILTWLTFIVILLFLEGCSKQSSHNSPKAVKGTLDLTQWKLDQKTTKLDGQWEFYWNQLLEPEEIKATDISKTGYIHIPSSWNRYISNDKKLYGDGYATYRLIFNTQKNTRLGIKVPRIFTSYNLWINGECIATAGTVGKERQTMIPQYLPQVAFFEAQQGENEIVIQVANFYHRSGGILESITIGNEKKIIGLSYKNIAYELLLFGSLMIMGAYHIALFLFRKKNTAPLYFGVFCLLIGIRTLLVGERFLIYLFPNFSWEIAHKLQTLTFYLGVPLIVMFSYSMFPNDFHFKIIRSIKIFGIVFVGLVLFNTPKKFTLFNPMYQIFTLIVMLYIFVIFGKIFFRKEKNIALIIVGALALILTSLNDIVFLSIWMNDRSAPFLRAICRAGNLSSVGQLIFMFTNSLVLAKKFSNALEHEEVMTKQLKEINLKLDDLVLKRTEALEESRKKVEYQKLKLEEANLILRQLSLKDPLTGLWNRRHYNDTIMMEWNKGLIYKKPVSLIILDIDYFKLYNDCYGHRAGDECLVQIAQAMKHCFKRANDLVARYGGEEFVVLMPDMGKDEAIEMAFLLRKAIEDLNIPHKCSSVSSWVTASIGVTSKVSDIDSSPQELFLAADRALYQAKNAGRNQVRFLP